MCRLFARASAEAYPATFGLLEAPDSVEAQSRKEPDGYGIGSFDKEGRPHVIKRAKAAFQDRAFPLEAHELRSRQFVAHIRFATNGENLERNTHPFTQHGRIFAHNGVVHGLDQLEARLRPAVPRADRRRDRLRARLHVGPDGRLHVADRTRVGQGHDPAQGHQEGRLREVRGQDVLDRRLPERLGLRQEEVSAR